MKLSLIRELNEQIREKDQFEKALAEADIEFDVDLSSDSEDDMSETETVEFDEEKLAELERIADDWRDQSEEMSDEDLADAIGDDLEQLDYTPEEISAGISKVMSMLGREEYMDDLESDEGDVEPETDDIPNNI